MRFFEISSMNCGRRFRNETLRAGFHVETGEPKNGPADQLRLVSPTWQLPRSFDPLKGENSPFPHFAPAPFVGWGLHPTQRRGRFCKREKIYIWGKYSHERGCICPSHIRTLPRFVGWKRPLRWVRGRFLKARFHMETGPNVTTLEVPIPRSLHCCFTVL